MKMYDVPVDSSRTLVRLYADLVVVDITLWYLHLKVIHLEQYHTTFSSVVGARWTLEIMRHVRVIAPILSNQP